MKMWTLMVAVLVCLGAAGGWALIGCGGDDDCEKACKKAEDCGILGYDYCMDLCEEDDCGAGCDTDASCLGFQTCVWEECGLGDI